MSSSIAPTTSSSSHRHQDDNDTTNIASSVFSLSGVGAALNTTIINAVASTTTASDAGRSIFTTPLLGTPPPPPPSLLLSTSKLSTTAHRCPYPSPLSPNGGIMTLPPLSPMLAPRQDNDSDSSSPILKLKPISELGLHPPLPVKHPLMHAPGRRRSLSMTHLPIYQHHYQYRQHRMMTERQYQLPSPAATILSKLDTDVCMSDGEDGASSSHNATRRTMQGYQLSSSSSRPPIGHTFSSPITMRPAMSSGGAAAAAAAVAPGGGRPADIGRRWWDTVVRTHHVPTSPSGSPLALRPAAIPIDSEYKREGEEVDELVESEDDGDGDGRLSEIMDERGSAPRSSAYPGSPLRRLLAEHDARREFDHHGGPCSTPSSPYQYSRAELMAMPSVLGGGSGVGVGNGGGNAMVAPSPTPSSVSLPAAFSHHSHHGHHHDRSPPSTSSASALRRTKPNYLNRPNVPLYNRSKLPTDGTATEHIFTCNYVPPRSSNPLATHQPTTQPCETTSLKKADMLRHMDEIHAKDEAERVFRGDLELECASRYLADLAEMVVKETKQDLEASVTVPFSFPSSSSSGSSASSGKMISNMVLRAQADSVRHNLRHEHDPTDASSSSVRFDFAGMKCEEFREVAMMRLATHRVWRCVAAGCGKVFGTQRSMERHKSNKHHQTPNNTNANHQRHQPTHSASQPILTSSHHQQENVGMSRGTKRTATDSPSNGGVVRHYLPASPLSHTTASALALDSSSMSYERPPKRSRTEGSGKTATPLMRVRQQTPEMRRGHGSSASMSSSQPMVGGGLQMDLGERSTLRAVPVKVEEDQLADDLLQLAEGGPR
ncbi:hypothetical protein FRB95_010272 [Tulasnella sp. JGI-2019a]|nr:hypothetical protein FRB95_010272 [Tulasnella sp. JGI-2019a]